SSMEESAIKAGFDSLKDGGEYDKLYQAAVCRQKADWLVGMNFTRLFSILYNAQLRVGRVQTPTLAMIVEREQKIKAFTKEPFYTVEITDGKFIAEREKVKDKKIAEDICSAVVGKTAVVTAVSRQEKSAAAPKLYDLTTLQREANRMFGYTAAQTLNCVQNLYEQKLSTYPRTDSQYLTDDMKPGVPALVQSVAGALPFKVNVGNINAGVVINSAKVSDHHAIIPTPSMPKADLSSLPTAERNILHMICTRLIAAVSDKYQYAETSVTVECEGETFTVKGKSVIADGWKAVDAAFAVGAGKPKKDEDKSLPDLSEGYRFDAKAAVREGFSQPPKHFTEDLLLAAMETAGADDMPDDAERKGLGTPATRAAIIENLVKSGFLERRDKNMLPTDKGVNLIKILPESVKSPMLTAEWENNLKRVERGDISDRDMMISIMKYVSSLITTNNRPNDEFAALFPSSRQAGEAIGKCPRCGGDVSESPKGFFCGNKSCKFALWKDNKFFSSQKKALTKDIAKSLLKDGRVSITGFVSQKTGKPYSATVILEDKTDGYPGFKMEFEQKKQPPKRDTGAR
ncbi:MAG: DNA topoisomerase, partial [Firmicutes bacterium]|nr:DNA topoisomerase [Bacillota bacterium]